MFRLTRVIIREIFCARLVTLRHVNVSVFSGWYNFDIQMVKWSGYWVGYIVVGECTAVVCCYCDWCVESECVVI
jgi:hypothetical protein